MKKKLTRLTSVFALAAASLGTMFWAGDADAAVLDRVTVVKPDSGAWRGIDSVFVVEAAIRTSQLDSNLAVYFWLVQGATADSILPDATNAVVGITDTIKLGTGSTASINARQGFVTGATSFVAARQRKQVVANIGDADSITVSNKAGVSGTDTLIYKWYGKVSPTVGTHTPVRVAAMGHDPSAVNPTTGNNFTTVKVSAESRQFKVDGDRPSNGTATIDSVNTAGGRNVDGYTIGASTRTVLGIGDSIRVSYNLNNQGDAVILTGDLSLRTQVLGKAFNPGVPATREAKHVIQVKEGNFDNQAVNPSSSTGVAGLFLVDKAGNWSSPNFGGVNDDAVPGGVTIAISFLADAKLPVLDGGVAAGDTILPVSNDTITDGSINANSASFPKDKNPITYQLAEALDSLVISFVASEASIRLGNSATPNLFNAALSANLARTVDFGKLGGANGDSVFVADNAGNIVLKYQGIARGDTPITTKVYSLKFKGRDLAGNWGPELTRTGVYVDVDEIALARLFPTGGGLDTLEEATSSVIFRLSEPADSVVINYVGIAGGDNGKTRSRKLVGSELTNTTSEQTFPVDSLVSGTDYVLTVLARDLAGNYTLSTPDTFRYDTTFQVPTIAKFAITADTSRTGLGSPFTAGDTLSLIVTAQTADGRTAPTYKNSAILKIESPTSGHGLTATGTGVGHLGSGRFSLNGDDWVVGQRTITIKDTTSLDTLSVSVVDSSVADSPYGGRLDSLISVIPSAWTQILVSAPDTVDQGETFMVNVTLADKFGNTRVADARFLALTANKLGVELASGNEIQATSGLGSFYAKATTFSGGGLILSARELTTSTLGKSASVWVRPADGSGVALDAPDTLIAEDYKGANGEGDQGGFVMLTFPRSDDHDSLTGYRIFREVSVDYDFDENGAVVALDEPTTDFIPWAKVDAVPGVAGNRVVVAALDNDATFWAVAAERGRQTTLTKQAFTGAEVVAAPYEVMAATIAKSKEAATALGKDAPIFAELTPEAQAFIANGVVPRLKTVGTADAFQSVKVVTAEAIKPVDNIAPAGVTFLKAVDTPNDQGGSITLTWLRSGSDQLITQTVSQAVGLGGNTFTQPGVQGYNVYRKLGEGNLALVGKVGPGETSFSDVSALNGVRYTYEVRPFDSDNETASLQKTAMAFRNSVLDQNGQIVLGLFGQDNSVGFDDFFIFADQFGTTKDDETFEAAFDLNSAGLSQGKIDFDDFFVFADYFGRKVDAVGKVLPTLAGLNTDAYLGLDAGLELPRVGEEMAVQVDLANFVAVKGYGFSVNYDPSLLEFVKVAAGDNNLLGEGLLAQPQIIAKGDGELSVVAYGDVATQGDLDLNLVFRAKGEIEDSNIELSNASLADDNYGVNQVASLGFARIQTRPEAFALGNNYPNPFNPETTIKYQLPEAADVKLEIYNVVGQVVRTLVAEHQTAGRYVVQWDASNDNGQSLSSGIYFYRVQAGNEFQQVKKMLLLK